jgi:Ca-activated chloride channel homolog
MRRRFALACGVTFTFLALAGGEARAQTGAIQGWVLDSESLPLPGVTVAIWSNALMQPRQTVTSPNGSFRFAGLPVGSYAVEATLASFAPAQVEPVGVRANGTAFVTLTMRLESLAAELLVTGSSPPIRRPRHLSPTGGRVLPRFPEPVQARPAAAGGPIDPADIALPEDVEIGTESYARIDENPFVAVARRPLSTFSIDVDTASYANVRRFLNARTLPPRDAVRIEELVNYFPYSYPQPQGDEPFSVSLEAAPAPWKPEHMLVRIGIKGRELEESQRPPSNLVFLIDVSGSMAQPDKLPLLQQALKALVGSLGERDRVAMVVYAGASGLVLDSTTNRRAILDALDGLEAGGSTNGGEGIELAYAVARKNFIKGGSNRVILCTDGDFNVGVTSEDALTRLIEKKAKSGVYLSVLGFGTGNYKDAAMELLSKHGNGNYAYVDSLAEARKVLVQQMSSTLFTIAKDVKIQVELNPARVAAYRLIGYENRLLREEDFADDEKDAGDIGAGHTVTALYELIPAGREAPAHELGTSKYPHQPFAGTPASDELLIVRLRSKRPDESESRQLEVPLRQAAPSLQETSRDFRFAAAVAAFGMLLRGSQHAGEASHELVLELARSGRGEDREGWRAELLKLVEASRKLHRR